MGLDNVFTRKKEISGWRNEHGGTDEEGEGKAAVFDRFRPVYVANGFGGSIISNYFKGVYQVGLSAEGAFGDSEGAAGSCGVFVIAALSGCGNLTLAMISFGLYAVGMFVLGLLSPGYLLMQLVVFIYSLGDHIVMPVRDAIAMDLADEGKTGTFLGKYRGICDDGVHGGIITCIYRVPVRGVLVPGGQIDPFRRSVCLL